MVSPENLTEKEQLKDLAKKYRVKLPTFIFTDDYEIYGVQDRPLVKTFKFNIIRTHEAMLKEEEDAGNEQRGQITESTVMKDTQRLRCDGMAYSHCVGKNVGGPLLGWIKNHDTLYFSNGRTRFILGKNVISDKYIIENDDTEYGDLFTGDWEIKDKEFSKWPDEIRDSYLNMKITSEFNVYYDDEWNVNLQRKSKDFIWENENVSDTVRIHALESPLTHYMKRYFGYRFAEYKTENGQHTISTTYSYLQIRNDCPMTILSDYILKAKSGKYKGYDKITNRRNLDRTPWLSKLRQLDLEGFEIGMETFLMFDNLYYNKTPFIDLAWKEPEFETMVKDTKMTKSKIKKYEKLCKRFSDFYRRLQDVNNCLYKSKQKLYGNNLKDIRFMWRIFLELERRGKFFDIDVEVGTKRKIKNNKEIIEVINGEVNKYEFGLENEITKLLLVFQKVYGKIGNKDDNNLWAHKRTFGKKPNQKKTINLFFNTYFSKEIEFVDMTELDKDGNPKILGKWELGESNYIEWDYKFKDPTRSFDPEIQSDSYHNNDEMCMITRKKSYHNLLQGHHKIFHEHGGISEEENCWMILSDLNMGNVFKENKRTSDAIRQLIIEQPDIFADGAIDYWNTEGLKLLEEEENNLDFYYFPEEM